MALADFTPERVAIHYKGKALAEVRGLCLEDVSLLVRYHLNDLQRLVELMRGADGDLFARLNMDGFLLKLISDAPVLTGNVIAVASDEPSNGEQARRLPLPVQIRILQEIVRLTFEDVGGPKAFVALVTEMIGKQLPKAEELATTP